MATTKTVEPVKRFAATATSPQPRFKTAEGYDKELVRLTAFRKSLFGLENGMFAEIDKHIASLESERRIDMRTDLPYKCLSLEPLTWKNAAHQPVFAVYSLDSPIMRIYRQYGRTPSIDPALPEPMAVPYRNAIGSHDMPTYGSRTISSRFAGLIPADVRAKIVEAQPLFQTKKDKPTLFLIAEATWSTTVTQPVVRRDPLVVGWDGNRLRLIAHFNLTSLERYMKDEFPG